VRGTLPESYLMDVYGEQFSWVYGRAWPNFSARLWPAIADIVRERLPDARQWLDLCCGSGHLLEILGREGYEATGLDSSPHQLQQARQSAPTGRLVEADVRDFDLGRQFDVITCLFDSINYLTTEQDLERAFANARTHLRDPGLFVFDVDTLAAYRNAAYVPAVRRTEEMVIVIEGWFDPPQACRHTLITGFVKEGDLYRRFEEEHVQRGYERGEIDALLETAGLDFETYDARTVGLAFAASDRLLYVCRHH
jgi:SAM-dependent methyltransferase